MKLRILLNSFVTAAVVLAPSSGGYVRYTPYNEARPILEAMAEIAPAEVRDAPAEKKEQEWSRWIERRDEEIRKRLAQGDIDSVVNFLMFGTSFTTEPRLTSAQVKLVSSDTPGASAQKITATWQRVFEKRVHDLVQGMAVPGTNERLQFARKTLARAGIPLSPGAENSQARAYIYENVKRVLHEQAGFQQTLAQAKGLNDPTEEFAERSKLYKERGLSLDTSLPPNYALEVALKEMRERKMLKAGSVVRVGIIGPGLDFTDKQEGYDFYPTQTVQPFAVMDSLLRLGLAKASDVEVDTLDLSPRILEHVEHAKRAAAKGRGYTIQLPRDPGRGWNGELVDYWKRFGDQIGAPAKPVAVPSGLSGVNLRAVRVRPDFVTRMRTYDVNIVLQRAEIRKAEEKFDLLIATNILVYYDTFEQSIALTNIAAMLKPGGYLLTNNALLELSSSQIHSVGYCTVVYSDHPDDGDHIVWYRKHG